MSGDACDKLHLLLQAELDGELDAAATITLLDHLQDCPECTRIREELRDLSARLQGGALTRYAAPASLRKAVAAQQPAAPRGAGRRGSHASAFGAGVAIAAAAAWLFVVPASTDGMPSLVDAHIRALQPGHLVDVESSDQHTVKPWFDGRIDFAPTVPDLAAAGFPLLGGRLDILNGRSVAALVYRHDKHLIDVFVAPGTPARSGAVQGYNIVGWTRDGMSYEAVSDLNVPELETFSRLMRQAR